MHPWKADAEGRDRQRFVRQRSDGGRIPAHHVPGQALHQDGLPADGKAPRTCGAGAAVSGRCAGLLLSDRPEKMLSLRGGQAMAVQPESYAALCGLVPPEQIGFLPAK